MGSLKKQKNTIHNEGENPSIETIPELTQIKEFMYKVIKMILIVVF